VDTSELQQNAGDTVRRVVSCNAETTFKDTQSHRYYIGVRGHPRSPAMSIQCIWFPVFNFNRNYPSLLYRSRVIASYFSKVIF